MACACRCLCGRSAGGSHSLCASSPADTNFDETLNTLKYANRARNIKNKPIVNRDLNANQIAALKRQIAKLRKQIAGGGSEQAERLRLRCRNADEDVQRLNGVTKELRRQLDRRTEEKLSLQAKFEQLQLVYVAYSTVRGFWGFECGRGGSAERLVGPCSFQQETGKPAPVQESTPGDMSALMASGVDPASVKLDDEASRDVSAGVPIDIIRKYVHVHGQVCSRSCSCSCVGGATCHGLYSAVEPVPHG